MSQARDKAQAFTKQVIGQMIGDDALVQEGKEQEHVGDKPNDPKPAQQAPTRSHHD
jgi:uncharacterized protein YjbJ (UPF0337 family)